MTLKHQRLSYLVDFVKEAQKISETFLSDVNKHELCFFEHLLKDLPGVHFNPQNSETDLWLVVDRSLPNSVPSVENNATLKAWLNISNDYNNEPSLKSKIPKSQIIKEKLLPNINIDTYSDNDYMTLNDFLKYKPQLKEEFNHYLHTIWYNWTLVEKKRSQTRDLYKKLYELEQEFKSSEEDCQKELVLGLGMILWKMHEGEKIQNICYPLITHVLNLNMNEQTEAIEITPKGNPQIYLDLYTSNKGIPLLEAEWKKWQQNLATDDNNRFSPYSSQTFNNILQSAASYLHPQGEYLSKDINIERKLPSASVNMKITDTWVIFLRPRSNESLFQDLEQFQNQLQKALNKMENESQPHSLPQGISALLTEPAESRPSINLTKFRGVYCQSDAEVTSNIDDTNQKSVNDLYFTMPSNEEQLKIIQKLEFYEGLVIQGPPGTGKTHTIANIISHYLTLGKRVLITSAKKTALNVLRKKLLSSIRPLAVSLLSNDQEDQKQLEHTITTIKNTINSIDENAYYQEINNLKQKIDDLHEKITHIERNIDKLMQKQFETIILNIDNHQKTFTPYEAAFFLSQNKSHKPTEWLFDRITINNVPLFSSESIEKLKTARLLVAENLNYYQIKLLEIPSNILNIIDDTHKSLIIYNQIKNKIDSGVLCSLVDAKPETYELASNLAIKIKQYIALNQKIVQNSLHFNWHAEIEQLLKKTSIDLPIEKFNDFYQELETVINKIKSKFILKPVTSDADLAFDTDIMIVIDRKIRGKSDFSFWQSSNAKTAIKQKIETIKIINNSPQSPSDWEHIYEYFQLQQQMKKLITVWNNSLVTYLLLKPTSTASYESLIFEIKKICEHYNMLIQKSQQEKNIVTLVKKLLPQYNALKQIYDNPEVLKEICHILDQNNQLNNFEKYIKYKTEIMDFFTTSVGDIFIKMHQFIEEKCGNPAISLSDFQNQWTALNQSLIHLNGLKEQFNIIQEVCQQIEDSGAILWAQALRSQPATNEQNDPLIPSDWITGWLFCQLEAYLEKLDGGVALQQLEKERSEKISDLKKNYEKIVERLTWLQVFQKMNPNIESALQSFIVYITKIGKGTGKRSVSYRNQANQALKKVIESKAIPCFIMPHNKISEILPSQFGAFDLVIIDEASQSDISSALPALIRGEKILIVGDDKQVGPNDAFDNIDKITNLTKRLLHSQVKCYQGHMNTGTSIYELFQVVFAHEKIMLKEHFRSVAPIIEYSNREFYHHQIKPMRSPKMSERLDPPLIDILVTDGRCDTSNNDINKAEARFIIDEIKKICNDPKMKHKTIGIITLKGDHQAEHITFLLNQELSVADIKKHQIKCGNARVFQGEERNIMFISLVVSFYPQHKKPYAMTKEDAKQRFNVAASRARDRMYLVRSINNEQLSSKDILRRNLISHFKTPFVQDEKKVTDLRQLCESHFEKEIYDILTQRGYRVITQLKIGNYRIDMVVEGDYDLRLAIECNGDRYHGPEQYRYDLNRQRILERNGWQFWRIFASNFFKNKSEVIQELINFLDKKGIKPIGTKNAPRSNYTSYREVTVFNQENEKIS